MTDKPVDEPADQLKAFERLARTKTTTNYRSIDGLEMARSHQRADRERRATQDRAVVEKRFGRAVMTPELRQAILMEEGSLNEVATRLGVSATTVFRVRKAAGC